MIVIVFLSHTAVKNATIDGPRAHEISVVRIGQLFRGMWCGDTDA